MSQGNIESMEQKRSPEEIQEDISRIKKELAGEMEQEKRNELEQTLDTYEKELVEAVAEEDFQ